MPSSRSTACSKRSAASFRLGYYPKVIERELSRYLPFLATTKVLMAAVRRGVGRETVHEVIKEHAVAALRGHCERKGASRTICGRASRRILVWDCRKKS